MLARWLALDPRILLFDEPTRGIDVGAKAAIHDLCAASPRDGAAVLMISSELPELIGMSDRIVVMRDGRIAGRTARRRQRGGDRRSRPAPGEVAP